MFFVAFWEASFGCNPATFQNFRGRRSFKFSVKIAFSVFVLGGALLQFAHAAPNSTPPDPTAVVAQQTQNLAPDLTVSAIRLREGEDKIGDDAHLEATVRNIGNAPTGRHILIGIRFFVNGEVVAWSATLQTALEPGQFAVIRTNSGPDQKGTWKVVAGTHTIRALVDDVNRIAESNEENNTDEVKITK